MSDYFFPSITIDSLHCQRNDLVDVLYAAIASAIDGSASQGESLVPVKILARHLRVAPQTLTKVYQHLERDGVLFRQSGRRRWGICERQAGKSCIGLVLPVNFAVYFNPETSYGRRHFRMYAGLVDRAEELGYAVLPVYLPPSDASEEEAQAALTRIRQKCCGLIHLGNRGAQADLPLEVIVACDSLPQLSLNCFFEKPSLGSVSFDSEYAVRLFVSQMKNNGHEKFAFVMTAEEGIPEKMKPGMQYALQQKKTVAKMFVMAGVEPDHLTIICRHEREPRKDRETIAEMLHRNDSPTAFFCRSDEYALEIMQIIREEGFRIPEDFSVVGFNNLMEAENADPPLSTLSNPLLEMGRILAEQMDRMVRLPGGEVPRVLVRSQFIPRKSSGARRLKEFG